MKNPSAITVAGWLLLGCGQHAPASLKAYIPGSYTRSVQNEFSAGNDTLTIAETDNGVYTIAHRLSFQRLEEGSRLPTERKTERWVALYDEKAAVLKESKHGRILSFQPEQNTLRVGGSEYRKIQP